MQKPSTLNGSVAKALPPRIKLGTVIEIQYRSNKRGSMMPWLKIKWDDTYAEPTWHMTMRIAVIKNQEDINKVVEDQIAKCN